MTPKTIGSSDNPTNRAQMERTLEHSQRRRNACWPQIGPTKSPCERFGNRLPSDGNKQAFSSQDILFFVAISSLHFHTRPNDVSATFPQDSAFVQRLLHFEGETNEKPICCRYFGSHCHLKISYDHLINRSGDHGAGHNKA